MAAEPAQTPLPLHRLDVHTYNQIVATGALEGRPVELLDGVLAQVSPQSPAHSAAIRRLLAHFTASADLWVDVQMPLELGPDSEPEPDLAVLAAQPPAGQHPTTALLVVEVAVSSQMIDRNVKAAIYAKAGIPTYWLVDVPGRAVELRAEPRPDGYQHCEIYREPASVPCSLKGIADLEIAALLADTGA